MADRRLQVFHAVAKHGSFTRAAENLYMTQPAVTFQIKQLEEHYNTRLFERGHGKVTLTPAGEIVMAYAERILGLNEELEIRVSELTDELTGTLNVGTSTTIAAYWLPGLLRDFKLHYPRVIPRVVVGNSQLIEDRVVSKELDLGMIEIVSDHPALERISACRDELLVIVCPNHPLASQSSLSAEDLLAHPLITRDPGNAIRALTEQYFEAAGVPVEEINVTAELGSLVAVKRMVEAGVGYAVASQAALQREVGEGRLEAIPLDPPMYTPLEVIYPRDKFRSRLITTFAEFATEALRARCLP